MKHDLNQALDECLSLLSTDRATLEECLARYPASASELRPLLEVAMDLRSLPGPASSPAAFDAGKRRMLEALAEKKGRQTTSPAPVTRHVGRIVGLLKELVEGKGRPITWKPTPALPLAVASALVLILIAIGGSFLLFQPGRSIARSASLDRVEGMVELMPAGSHTWRAASTGDRVEAGSQMRTGPSSSASLTFFDGSTVDLESQTEVAIVQMNAQPDGDRVIVLNQALGHTHSRVQKVAGRTSRFEIETPAAVAMVRGTEFTTIVEASGRTSVMVADGLVEVTAQGTTVEVSAGQMTSVRPGEPPAAASVIPEPEPPETVTAVPGPTSTPTPTATPTPSHTPKPLDPPPTSQPADQSPPPDQTPIPQQSDEAETPESSAPTKTHQPPGLTKTPQPPGQTKTPPGQELKTKEPKPKKTKPSKKKP